MSVLYDDLSGQDAIGASGTRYPLARRLGVGGQGAVYEVSGGRLAVKVRPFAGEADRDQLERRIAYVRRLDLGGLPIARPLEALRAPAGYVMDLLAGMQPLTALISPPRGTQDLLAWHLEGGGLRRRLRLLARLADVLSTLHGRALVYGDLSPSNVFVPLQSGRDEAWLIDADNLHVLTHEAPAIGTPRYAAPELMSGRAAPSPATDGFSFAVVAYELLTLAHPFLGDAVTEGPPEEEEAAFRGERPYVDHPADRSNARSTGLPLGAMASRALQGMFNRTFVEGLHGAFGRPPQRPSLSAWSDTLYAAADLTVVELSSQATSITTGERTCFWTGRGLGNVVRVELVRAEPRAARGVSDVVSAPNSTGAYLQRVREGRAEPLEAAGTIDLLRPVASWGCLAFSPHERLVVRRRHADGTAGSDGDSPCLTLSFDAPGRHLVVRAAADAGPVWISRQPVAPPGEPLRPVPWDQCERLPSTGERRLLVTHHDVFLFHFGSPDSPHRVASLAPGRFLV